MEKIYIGIDPGAKGFISVMGGENNKILFYSISDLSSNELNKILFDIRNKYMNICCIMENVHALHQSAAKATFSFGEIFGLLKGLLIANTIPYHLIPPKTWQKEKWANPDMVVAYKQVMVKGKATTRKEVNTKATSLNAALRLFPDVDFRKTPQCKKHDDNKVDSLLIAEYRRRKNL